MVSLALAALLLTTACATTSVTSTEPTPTASCYARGKAAGTVDSERPTPADCGAMYWLGRMVGAPSPEYRGELPPGVPIGRR